MAAAAAVAAGVTGLAACSAGSGTAFYGSPGIESDGAAAGDATSGIAVVADANASEAQGGEDAPSAIAFDGSVGIGPPLGASDAQDDGPRGGEDAPSAVAFYGIANPIPVDDAGDATTGASDAHEDGPHGGEDAPSVVAFYGIANPKPGGHA
jgi:hypothetical protein